MRNTPQVFCNDLHTATINARDKADAMYEVRNANRLLVDVCDIVPTVDGKTLVFRVEIGYSCDAVRHNYGFELDKHGNVCPGSEYIKATPGFQGHHELSLRAAQECFTGRNNLLEVKIRHCGNFRAVRSATSGWNWMFMVINTRRETIKVAA
jgi:hypothetical protein